MSDRAYTMNNGMVMAGLEFGIEQYAREPTFGGYDPSMAMLAGGTDPSFLYGMHLAAKLRHEQRQATLDLRAEARR